jgi:hypothetical protein
MYVAFWHIVVPFQVWQNLDYFFKCQIKKKLKSLFALFFNNYF